jgi:hypothetical protein
MSVNLTPLSARSYSVGSAKDPYKKYWWVILGGFVMTGFWLFLPAMETPVGSVHVDLASKAGVDASSAEQNLDSADNPNGAAGGAIDLSMDGSKHKSKGDEESTSMLYQGADSAGAAAAGAPLGTATSASAASLAQQLKDAGKPKDASSGWNEKAQRGFDAPHLSGAALGGLGSARGGSSASAGGSGAFGIRGANVGLESAHGLHDDGSADVSAGFKALKSAAGAGSPSLKGSNEDMHAASSSVFDGKKGNVVAGAGTGAMASANAALNAAPADLKENDPTLSDKKLPDPPAAPTAAAKSQAMGEELLLMAATAVVGGVAGGVAAAIVGMMGSTLMQQQAASTAAQSSATTNQRLGTTQ